MKHNPVTYVLASLLGAEADSARTGIAIDYLRDLEPDDDDAAGDVDSPRAGLPRLTTIEVTPEEVGPDGVRLDEASRTKLAAAGADPDQVERELHGMRPGDKKLLADVVFGAKPGLPRAELDEQLRWYCIAPTEEEEELIARGETVTFLVGAAPLPDGAGPS